MSPSESDSSQRFLAARSGSSSLYPAGFPGVSARFITLSSGLRVRVVEAGTTNRRRVVLVPGWGCGAWIFHDTLPFLASKGFHAVAVELKGHGLSDKPDNPTEFTVESMSDHLREIIDALAFDRTAIIAHSMGASIAVHLAQVERERVAGLVLAAPVGFAGVKGMTLLRLITPKFALPVLQLLATRLLIRGMLSVVYGSIRRASNQDIDEFFEPTRVPGFIRSLRYLLHEFEWSREFPRLGVPVMTIVGDEDVLSPSVDVDRYAGDPTIVIRGAAHVLFDEAPEILNPAIESFLTSRVYISRQNE